jgi:Zn-dependent M16 (insulinase) family peptidase
MTLEPKVYLFNGKNHTTLCEAVNLSDRSLIAVRKEIPGHMAEAYLSADQIYSFKFNISTALEAVSELTRSEAEHPELYDQLDRMRRQVFDASHFESAISSSLKCFQNASRHELTRPVNCRKPSILLEQGPASSNSFCHPRLS